MRVVRDTRPDGVVYLGGVWLVVLFGFCCFAAVLCACVCFGWLCCWFAVRPVVVITTPAAASWLCRSAIVNQVFP